MILRSKSTNRLVSTSPANGYLTRPGLDLHDSDSPQPENKWIPAPVLAPEETLEIRMNCVVEYTSLNIIPVAQALTNINAGKLFDGNRYCLLTHTLHFGIIVDSYTALS